MKIVAHITFFYDPKRLGYLKEVINSLLELDSGIDIFLYTNEKFDLFRHSKNIKLLFYPYVNNKINFSYKSIFNKLGLKKLINPYYLTWENRKIIEDVVDTYDIQIYLEDDIKFTNTNLNYWLNYNEIVTKKGYNLGFFRVEFDETEKMITDLTRPLTKMVSIDNIDYIVNDNNPYCGFWIYSKEELKQFIKSKEWKFDFKQYGIREKSAIGWHGKGMRRYKETIIPLKKEIDKYMTTDDCTVHHLPNNYINSNSFCSIKFPIILSKEIKHNAYCKLQ